RWRWCAPRSTPKACATRARCCLPPGCVVSARVRGGRTRSSRPARSNDSEARRPAMTATTSPPPAGSTVQRPTSVDEAVKVLRDSRGSVLFRGAGTKMSWAGRPEDPDLVLETGGLDRMLDHNPADMTASAQAGMPLRALQDRLAEAGQWLALDPPTEPDGATLGGLLATGESGPRRLRYGALRDLVIGVTLVLSDGTLARAGGHVIKNVAGYDLTKLMYGSLGTLGLIAEVVLRLHPRPETSATVVAASTVQE